MVTLWKTNMSPENGWLEDVFPIEIVPFYGTFVHFLGCNFRGFPPPSMETPPTSLDSMVSETIELLRRSLEAMPRRLGL